MVVCTLSCPKRSATRSGVQPISISRLAWVISGMEVKEDNENYMNAVDYMFKGLEKRKPDFWQ